jgi:hypothetical protein
MEERKQGVNYPLLSFSCIENFCPVQSCRNNILYNSCPHGGHWAASLGIAKPLQVLGE